MSAGVGTGAMAGNAITGPEAPEASLPLLHLRNLFQSGAVCIRPTTCAAAAATGASGPADAVDAVDDTAGVMSEGRVDMV